jgi:DNA-directed RNA polymerase subunit RPC12/RpoP
MMGSISAMDVMKNEYRIYTCDCGHRTGSYIDLGDYECGECKDKRLGKKKVLTVKIDTKTIHYEFRGKEECKEKAVKGVEQIYKQFSIK